MNPVRLLLAAALTAGTVLLSAAGASAAVPAPGPAYGHHVALCAKTMGFSGTQTGRHAPGQIGMGRHDDLLTTGFDYRLTEGAAARGRTARR